MVSVTGKSYAFFGLMMNYLALFMLILSIMMGIGMAAGMLFQGTRNNELVMIVSMLLGVVITTALYIWVWKCNSSMSLSFVDGFSSIAEGLMSGCYPLTAVYLFPTMLIVFLIALFNSIVSLFRGKAYAQERWVGIVEWFEKHRIGG